MIFKSYLVEQNLNILKNNFSLFFGENFGLKEDFKNKIKTTYKDHTILKILQDDILKNKNILTSELQNLSLFENKKIIIIQNANDKLTDIIKETFNSTGDIRVFVFSDVLEKKSKLRIFFEKEKNTNAIPCYQDNEITLRKITLNELKNYKGITPTLINLIVDNSSLDRMKLKNEIEKIKSCFLNKPINAKELTNLLDIKEDDNFGYIRDAALLGKNIETNKLLNTILIEEDKLVYYLSALLIRLNKLKEVAEKADNKTETIDKLSPPIFWKDKPNFIEQTKIWNSQKLHSVIKTTYDVEVAIKSNSNINRKTILRKLIVDICNLANAA